MWIWWSAAALAGDVSLYSAALRLVDEHYLWPERVDHAAMFVAAAQRIEDKVEPVLVQTSAAQARLEVGKHRWTVTFHGDLPAALGELEDAVRASGAPLRGELDLRAELLKGALSTLDRHTVVLVGEGLERFDERLSGTLTGIGVSLSLRDGGVVVSDVYPNGPAERAGLLVGDRLVRIDGVPADGMTPTDATAHIRGRLGTPVVLDLVRGLEPLRVELMRAEITIPNVEGEAGPHGVGVVRIDHFSEQTVPNLERVLEDLRGRGLLDIGLVLDLRGNSGGSLVQSAKSADTFVDRGRIVTTNGRGGAHVPGLVHALDAKPDARAALPPVVVLVDHETASGAEILSGALRELDRAVLLGETTFGKGTVQTLWSLGEGIKLKLTVAEYTLADDVHVHEVGIVPDLALYPVRVGDGDFWYPDAARLRARLAPDTPVLYYPDVAAPQDGDQDDTLDLAAAILAAGAGPTRASVLHAEELLLPSFRMLQATRVDEAARSLSLDWAPAAAVPARVDVEVKPLPMSPGRAGIRSELQFEVTNRGDELRRAALRLRSVNDDLDDRVLPLGRLAPGETRVVRGTVVPAADSATRTDRLVGVLECDGCAPAPVVDTTFGVEGAAAPTVRVAASVAAGTLRLEVTNTGSSTLTGVRVKAPFPDLPGVELAPPTAAPTVLAPGAVTVVEQRLSLATATPSPLALRVEVAADGFSDLARWDLPVAADGTVTRRDAPSVELSVPRGRQAAGTTVLQLRLADGDGLDHVLVFAGSERVDRARWDASIDWDQDKVFYRGALGRRAHLSVPVPVRAGSNRIVVIAEDQFGVRTRRELYVYGEGAPRVDDGVAFGP